MTGPTDVIVIGGGLVGSACALALTASGATVMVLQPAEAAGAGWMAAAGMLAAQIEASPDDPLTPLAIAGRNFYRRMAPSLLESTGIDVGLVECGIVQLALTEADVAAAKAKLVRQRQQAHRAEWLSQGEVADGWPWLAPSLGAFWSPEDGAVDPLRTVAAFRLAAERGGARFVSDAAVELLSSGGRITGVRGETDRYSGRDVVIANGAWSGQLAGLPRPLSVEPVRGQMAVYGWPAGVDSTVVYGPGCYLLRRGDELLAGSTMEHVGFDAQVSASGVAAIVDRIAAIYPEIRHRVPTRSWAGLRPGTPDGAPIIGAEPRLAGLWYATGHGRNGVLLAGITGERIAQMIAGEALDPLELAPARPERFWHW